jgi:phospholipid/cholesterol/gamma-HCH transport system permease protein
MNTAETNVLVPAQLCLDADKGYYVCKGHWSTLHVDNVLNEFAAIARPTSPLVRIDGQGIDYFDSAGAVVLLQCVDSLKSKQIQTELVGFSKQYLDLIEVVTNKTANIHYNPPEPKNREVFYNIGAEAAFKYHQVNGLLVLIGDVTCKLLLLFRRKHRFHMPSVVSNMASAGLSALPIIGLLSFLIGVVLAYQMGFQLETYGAVSFIAYISGMSIFREFGPLITAIIIAGRTSSAFTAQIGSMKINEEIDALHTMGLSPTELLVVPKLLASLIMFPLLIFWADFFATLGAMIMSKYMLNIQYMEFLSRLRDSVGLKQLMLGLYKAPVFAILTSLVGCFQGFQVGTSADSVGSQTTRAVVQALFLIIITDAGYSVIYRWLGL